MSSARHNPNAAGRVVVCIVETETVDRISGAILSHFGRLVRCRCPGLVAGRWRAVVFSDGLT